MPSAQYKERHRVHDSRLGGVRLLGARSARVVERRAATMPSRTRRTAPCCADALAGTHHVLPLKRGTEHAGGDRAFKHIKHVAHHDLRRRPAQFIAAMYAMPADHQSSSPQLRRNLSRIGQRQILSRAISVSETGPCPWRSANSVINRTPYSLRLENCIPPR